MLGYLEDSPEYKQRLKTPFVPSKVSHALLFTLFDAQRSQVTLPEIRATIPKHLYEKSTAKGLFFFARDVISVMILYKLGTLITPLGQLLKSYELHPQYVRVVTWSLWALYFHAQGVVFAGLWCLGHEAGHGTLSPHSAINHALGFVLHTVSHSYLDSSWHSLEIDSSL